MPVGHEVDARATRGAATFAGAVVRLGLLVLALALLLPLHLLGPRRSAHPSPAARSYLRIARRLLRLRFHVEGVPAGDGAFLLVSNHVSWADIMVLGSAFPGSFVAKSEVAGWPILGWLVRQHGTIFVERARRGMAGQQRDAIADRLRSGSTVILFPEGTSSDGRQVLPFKSALFASAVSASCAVQPVTIVWTAVGGRPVDESNRRMVAWIDDMDLLPHVWDLLCAGGAEARLICNPAVTGSDRRELALRSQESVTKGLELYAADLRSDG
jgi:1-acyl-sn-glycerol-3-phosphate acyltransferase